jgi:hypothetical protein
MWNRMAQMLLFSPINQPFHPLGEKLIHESRLSIQPILTDLRDIAAIAHRNRIDIF